MQVTVLSSLHGALFMMCRNDDYHAEKGFRGGETSTSVRLVRKFWPAKSPQAGQVHDDFQQCLLRDGLLGSRCC